MSLLRFQTLFMAILFSLALMSATAPAANAGIFGFIKRHFFSNSSNHQKKTSSTHHRLTSHKTAHRSKQENGQSVKLSFSHKTSPTRQFKSKLIGKEAPETTALAYNNTQDKLTDSVSSEVLPQGIPVFIHQPNLDRRVVISDAIQPERIVLDPTTPTIQTTKHAALGASSVVTAKPGVGIRHQKLVALAPKFQSLIPEQVVQPKAPPVHFLSAQKNYNDKDSAPPEFDENAKSMLAEAPLLSKLDSSSTNAIATHTAAQKANNDLAFSTRASWYGPGFDGKRTASGQRFNTNGLTAASRTLKFGSQLLVANPATGKCCTVTINDRGPYVSGRDIDLSHGAAARIGVTGVSPVICVAYAGSSEPESLTRSNAYTNRRHRHHKTSTRSGAPAKVNSKVLHYIAGVM